MPQHKTHHCLWVKVHFTKKILSLTIIICFLPFLRNLYKNLTNIFKLCPALNIKFREMKFISVGTYNQRLGNTKKSDFLQESGFFPDFFSMFQCRMSCTFWKTKLYINPLRINCRRRQQKQTYVGSHNGTHTPFKFIL